MSGAGFVKRVHARPVMVKNMNVALSTVSHGRRDVDAAVLKSAMPLIQRDTAVVNHLILIDCPKVMEKDSLLFKVGFR